MKNTFTKILSGLSLILLIGAVSTACTPQPHCPGTASTGRISKHKQPGCKGGNCTSTGTIKPKVNSRKMAKQRGMFSKDMVKAMRSKQEKTELKQ